MEAYRWDEALRRLEAAVDDVLASAADGSLDALSGDEVLGGWRRLQTVTNRLATADHAVIGQVSERHLDHERGASSVAVLARQALRVGIGEARARVAAAEAAGPRRALTGERLGPVFVQVATAQASGAIAPANARLVVQAVDRLPDVVADLEGERIETFLVEQAGVLDPDALAKVTQRLIETVDPDGTLRDPDYRQRRRELDLHVRADGSSTLRGELTAECTERVRVLFDALAGQVPGQDGTRDERTPTQRRHDALLDACVLTARAQLLPDAGGVTTTVVLTAGAADWAAGTGRVTTGHGVTVATEEARRWAGDVRIIGVVFRGTKAVAQYSSTQRLFGENQRLVLAARDLGCSFPGCDAPPQRCQAHHVVEWSEGGPTTVDNGTLLCGFHHRQFEAMGWSVTMTDGRPWWRPPSWVDPHRTPLLNRTHDPAAVLTRL